MRDQSEISNLLLEDYDKIEGYILSHCEVSLAPKVGSLYILPSGEFVVLPESHDDLFADIEDTLNIQEQDVRNVLSGAQWIRCNSALGTMSYIELNISQPTQQQYEAIEEFADLALAGKGNSLSVVCLNDGVLASEAFSEVVAGSQVVKSIKKFYTVGIFIPSSAFEQLVKKPERLTEEEAQRRLKEIYDRAKRKH
ncbi:MAG: hypothetical protein NC218_01495 [Acetobacter sp.]|nr:hypothetical protein [Acetobacter sp.]